MASKKQLIDANALTDTLEDIDWYHINEKGCLVAGANPEINIPLYKAEDIYHALINAPTVDAVEVVHGKWEGEADGYADGELVYDVWYCSECNYLIDDGTDDPAMLPNYCPNCGAKMDLEVNNESNFL